MKRKIKNYRRWGILLLVLLVAGISGLIWWSNFAHKVQAAWFDDTFTYRKLVPIATHTASENNVYITFQLDTATLISAGKMQSSCQDVRVTDFSGNLLKYHVGRTNACNNAATTIDALLSTMPAGAQDYYVYYGNQRVSSNDSGAFTQSVCGNSCTTNPTLGSEENTVGPIANWNLDEGSGTAALDSVGKNNATLAAPSATPTWQTEELCVSGKCLLFDGTDDTVASVANVGISGSASRTVIVWFKQLSQSNKSMVGWGSCSAGHLFDFMLYNGSVIGHFCGSGFDTIAGAPAYNVGVWNQAAITYDGTTVKIYVNGQIGNSLPMALNTDDGTVNIGDGAYGPYKYFNGFIDDPKIYNYALTADQIKLNYNSRSAALAKGATAVLGANNLTALNKGLVGYWKLDEATGTNTVDSSGHGYSGTLANSPTWTTGKFGSGVSFDGVGANHNVITLGDQADFELTTLTVSAWVKRSGTCPFNICTVFSKGMSSNTGYALEVQQTGGNYVAAFSIRDDLQYVAGSTVINTGQWYLVTATIDTKRIRIYVNGVLDADVVQTQTPTFAAEVGKIGNRNGNSDITFNGTIDDVRLYNRAFSPSEVAQLYNFAPGPNWYLDFEENGGSSTLDKSGSSSANPGTWAGSGGHWGQGKFGSAGIFNGVDDVVTDNFQSSKNSGTIEFWAKPNQIRTMAAYYESDGTAAGDYNGFGVGFDALELTAGIVSGSWRFDYQDGTSDVSVTGGTPAAGKWDHVAVTWDRSNTLRLYVNSQLVGISAMSGVSFNSKVSTIMQIGKVGDGTATRYWDGSIDEMKSYNYERTQKQIIQDMNGGHPVGGSPVASQVNYWDFGEGQGTVANDSGYSAVAGTLTNMSSPASVGISGWNPSGKFGNAISFDGVNDHVDFGDMPNLEAISTMSASFWVNPNSLAQKICLLCKFQQASAANKESFGIETGVSNGNAVLMELSTDGNTATASGETPAGALTVGKWNHIVAVFDGGQIGNLNRLKIYVNGVAQSLAFTGTIPSATWSTSSNLRVGASSDSTPARLFSGSMDEVKIYLGALNQSDVLIDYNRGQSTNFGVLGVSTSDAKTASNSASSAYCIPGDTSSCSGPTSIWNFDEGSGTSTNDSSGNSYSGTLTLGPSWGSGKINKGVVFDGVNDYVSVSSGYTNLLSAKQNFTVEGWFFVRSYGATGGMFWSRNGANNVYGYVTTAGKLRMTVGTSGVNCFSDSTASVVSLNRWYHIAWVKTGTTTGKAYVNGVQVIDSSSLCSTPTGGSENLNIGEYWSSELASFPLNGFADNVITYGYSRTPAQIAYDYSRGQPLTYFDFDECQGTTVHDLVGTNSATLTIGTGAGTGHQDAAGTCTTSATTVWYDGRVGKYNYSANFDGIDDFANAGGSNELDARQSFSACSWVNLSSAGGGQTILGKGRDGSSTYSYVLEAVYSGGAPRFELYDGSNNPGVSATTVLSANQWYQVCGTYNGTTMKIYINGKLENQTATTIDPGANSSDFVIAKWPNAASTYLSGKVDDVKIFNYPLTDYQIKINFNQGAAVRFGLSSGAP